MSLFGYTCVSSAGEKAQHMFGREKKEQGESGTPSCLHAKIHCSTTCCQSHAANDMLPVTCCQCHAASHMLQVTCCQSHAANVMLPVTCCKSHAASHMLPMLCCQSHAANDMLPVTCCQCYAASHMPPMTCCQLHAANNLLASRLPPFSLKSWIARLRLWRNAIARRSRVALRAASTCTAGTTTQRGAAYLQRLTAANTVFCTYTHRILEQPDNKPALGMITECVIVMRTNYFP
eukprot:1158371-Pelagomonas_calceolata.AAC.15